MNEYMGDFLFDTFQPFHFYCDQSVDFVILNETDKHGYISKYTKHLPPDGLTCLNLCPNRVCIFSKIDFLSLYISYFHGCSFQK